MIQEKWFNTKNRNSLTKEQVAQIVPTVPATSTEKNQKDKDTYGQILPLQRKFLSALYPDYTIVVKGEVFPRELSSLPIATV